MKKGQHRKRRQRGEHKEQIVKQKIFAPDVVLKEYWRSKEEFADLFNAYVYNGKKVIDSESLQEIDTDITGYTGKNRKRVSSKGARDIIKLAMDCNGVRYVLLGLENQNYIHYAMPLKVMGYDLFSYNSQKKEKRVGYKQNNIKLSEDELLSGLRKDDRLIPVITLVLYTGRKKWDGPLRLADMLEIPEELKGFVPDYKINIVEMRKNDLKLNNRKNQDLLNILGILYNEEKKLSQRHKEIEKYEKSHQIEDEVKMAVSSITGRVIRENEEETFDMKTIWDEIREYEREEGRKEARVIAIIKISRKYSATHDQSIENIMEELKVSREQAEEYYREYSEKIDEE